MKSKGIDLVSNIISKRHGIFKLHRLFFQMQEKLETCRDSNFTNFSRPILEDDINVTSTL